MSTQRRESKGRRGARGRIFLLERLEDRRLLAAATEAFTGPSLSGLISQAFHGKDTAGAAIKTMLSALQTQLTDGPLANLNSSAVDGNGFITEVQSLVASFNQNVDQQLLPHFTHIDNMLKLQGQQVVANLVSLNQQSTVNPQGTVVGLTSPGSLPTQAGAAINTLTGGPIYSLKTPVSAYVTATQTFETNLGVLANSPQLHGDPDADPAQGQHHHSGRGRGLSRIHGRRSPGHSHQSLHHGELGRDDPGELGHRDRQRQPHPQQLDRRVRHPRRHRHL